MTGIIIGGIEKIVKEVKKFSLFNFYLARAG